MKARKRKFIRFDEDTFKQIKEVEYGHGYQAAKLHYENEITKAKAQRALEQWEGRSMTQIQRDFEEAWSHAFKVYHPYLCRPEDGQNMLALVSAVKGLAWSMYYQGRTDGRLPQLVASYTTAQLARKKLHAAPE